MEIWFIMGAFAGPEIINDSLQFYLDAANKKSYPGSGTIWYDLTDNSDGTLNTPTYNGDNGGSFVFDGNDNVLSGTRTISLTAGFTAMMGIKWNTFAGGSFQFNANPGYMNFYNGGSANLRWETYFGSSMTSAQSLSTGRIYFVAATFSGVASNGQAGTGRIYINGTLDNTASIAGASSLTSSFTVGEYAGFTNGTIYNVLFYNRELTAREIQQNFNAFRGRLGL